MSNFQNLIFGFLGGYGALLGPIDGIAIADYWIVRRRRLALRELYQVNGRYSYSSGVNKNGIYALIIGIVIPLAGLVIPSLSFLWSNAWTIGLLVAMAVYSYLMRDDKSLLSLKEYEEITLFMNNDETSQNQSAAVNELN